MKQERSGVKEKKKKDASVPVKSMKDKDAGTTVQRDTMQSLSANDDTDENQIVPLDPRQTFLYRDFSRTNNILNKSIDLLSKQNDLFSKKVAEAKEEDQEEELQKAMYDVRQNAHTLAALVGAKAAYVKAIK